MWGSGDEAPSHRRQEDLGAELSEFGDFYNFLRLKFLLKNIFLIYSIIQNG